MTMETSTDTPRRTGAPRTLLVFGLLAWVAIVTAAFYAVHTPISPAMAQAGPLWSTLRGGATAAALLRTAQDLAAVLAITVLAVGAGSLLLQLILRGRVIGHLERWSFGAALGLGLLAHAFFLLGLAGGLRPLPAWLLLAVFAALALAGYLRWPWPPWSRAPALHDEPPLGLLPRVVQGFLLIALLLTLTRALAPPVAWDSHVYHLTAPLQYLEQGKITAGLDVPHFYFPALVEQLYTLGLLLRGDTVAQPLHLVLAAVGLLALFGFLRQRHGARVAWLGAGILASSISLWSLAGYAYVEWGLLAFCTLAFWALRNALDQERASWLLVSGICLGLALGVKYTAAFMALGLGSYLLWTTIRRDTLFAKSFPNWQHLGLWMLTVATVASPWYSEEPGLHRQPLLSILLWRPELGRLARRVVHPLGHGAAPGARAAAHRALGPGRPCQREQPALRRFPLAAPARLHAAAPAAASRRCPLDGLGAVGGAGGLLRLALGAQLNRSCCSRAACCCPRCPS